MLDDIRSANRAAVESRILEAVQRVLAEDHPATLSMPRVAGEAGVSLRTLYRYFPTKEALVDAASRSFEDHASAATVGPVTMQSLGEYLAVMWSRFTENIGAVKAQHVSPVGREVRAARLARSRAFVRSALADEGVDVPARDLERLVDLIVLLTSSSAYLELVDRFGESESDAAALVAWAVSTITARAREEGVVAP